MIKPNNELMNNELYSISILHIHSKLVRSAREFDQRKQTSGKLSNVQQISRSNTFSLI